MKKKWFQYEEQIDDGGVLSKGRNAFHFHFCIKPNNHFVTGLFLGWSPIAPKPSIAELNGLRTLFNKLRFWFPVMIIPLWHGLRSTFPESICLILSDNNSCKLCESLCQMMIYFYSPSPLLMIEFHDLWFVCPRLPAHCDGRVWLPLLIAAFHTFIFSSLNKLRCLN